MPTQPLTRQQCADVVRAVKRYADRGYEIYPGKKGHERGAFRLVAQDWGLAADTVRHRYEQAGLRFGLTAENIDQPECNPLDPDADRPCPMAILDRHTQANTDYIARKRTKPAVFMVKPEPFAVAFIGDPHLSNAGCNLQALRDDLSLLRDTGTRAVQMGDLLDNFHRAGPKLAAKEAQNRMSIEEALSVAEWMVADSGIKWDAHIIGNHDAWLGAEGVSLIGTWAARARSRIFDWNARLIYRWGDGEKDFHHVAASHDFKGHSQYNPTHGPAKQALWDGTADTYVAAHRHNHAEAKVPNGWRGKTYQLVRVRGYKDADSYAAGRAQFPAHDGMEGRAALLVVNPLSETHDGRQRVFMDLGDGIEYLNAMRRRYT